MNRTVVNIHGDKNSVLLIMRQGEESNMEAWVRGLAEAGISVVISGGAISELAMHFLDKYKILVTKISSKFELRRICRTLQAVSIIRSVSIEKIILRLHFFSHRLRMASAMSALVLVFSKINPRNKSGPARMNRNTIYKINISIYRSSQSTT